jgi:hypothetical protein
MTTTLKPIRKKAADVQFLLVELELLDAFVTDGLIRHLKDSKSFDPLESKDDANVEACRLEEVAIRNLRTKITAAIAKIEREHR